MPYSATAVANEFLVLAKGEAQPITPLHVQKYVYFAHGWYLAFKHNPLIKERIEAWDYGPVVPSLYQGLKQYGSGPILSLARETVITRSPNGGIAVQYRETRIDEESEPPGSSDYARALINRIWDVYKGFTALQLSQLTHEEDTPWSRARSNGWTIIPDQMMEEYFTKQLRTDGK